jgi:CRISPR-associated protein (TIGR03986 family)
MPNNYSQNRQQRGPGGGYGGSQPSALPDSIPSPYNFVPLSEKVVFPDWADQVSMDVPFRDGISGTINLRITAVTDVYIRSGGDHPRDPRARSRDPKYQDFFRVTEDGQYAIPGSSFKGMLRSVVEIAGFGKLGSGCDEHRYAVRDLNNKDSSLYVDHMTGGVRPHGPFEPRAKGGWLYLSESGGWQIQPCEFARIEQEELENSQHGRDCKLFLGARMSAREKYAKWGAGVRRRFNIEALTDHPHSGGKRLRYRRAELCAEGGKPGVLVFTGQPSPRLDRDGRQQSGSKHMEFVFFDESAAVLEVPEPVCKDFAFVHSDPNGVPNEEWGYWRGQFREGRKVPVFYLEEQGAVASVGLAMMYRLPYKHTIHDAIRHTSADHLDAGRMDISQLIFGHVRENAALRGRCTVGTLLAEGAPRPKPAVTTILNGPKPTYYPNYMEQKAGPDGSLQGHYATLMHAGCRVRGWKRYPVASPAAAKAPGERQETVSTVFSPLPAGTVFLGQVRAHNLRPEELGAIIWALRLGDTKGNLLHSIGMAKPYHYGAIKVEIASCELKRICDGSPVTVDEAQSRFAEFMEGAVPDWAGSPQIKALQKMSNLNATWPMELAYPVLGRGRDNQFVGFKKDYRVLGRPADAKVAGKPAQGASNDTRPKELVEKSAIERLIEDAPRLKQGELKKRLAGIESLSQTERARLVAAVKRNANQPHSYTPPQLDWRPDLEALASRIKDRAT